jgi:hypothetical protein
LLDRCEHLSIDLVLRDGVNLPLRTRAVIEFLTEVVRADPAMSNLGVIANEAQEPEAPGQRFPGDSLSAS